MGTRNNATSQNVPGSASAGHNLRVARSRRASWSAPWRASWSATGLELRPELPPQRLDVRRDLVEREPLVEVPRQHNGTHEVFGYVALVDQIASGQLVERRLIAVETEVLEGDVVVEKIVDHQV